MEQAVRKIALLGMGTVGGGVYEIIEKQKEEMPFKIGAALEVVKVLVRNKAKYADRIPAEKLTDVWEDVIGDDSIDIVVEVMGGIEPARTYIKAALEKGKHVVTANKDLMAMHGHELLELAGEHHCDLLFEAAVAGGIPIIRPLKQCLAGNNITEIMGIINGTTNFILTKMKEDGMDFGEALQLATDLGYAEADPTADIEGYDAGRKLAIMASIAFHTPVTFDDVFTEGITKITAKDMRYAKEMGCSIKLLGIAKNTETGIEVKVHPTMIPENHPLAAVNDCRGLADRQCRCGRYYGCGAQHAFPLQRTHWVQLLQEPANQADWRYNQQILHPHETGGQSRYIGGNGRCFCGK